MVSVAPERTRRRADTSGSSIHPTGAIGLAARGSAPRLAGVEPKKMQNARPGGQMATVAHGGKVRCVRRQAHVQADVAVDFVAPGAHGRAQRQGLPHGIGRRRVVQAGRDAIVVQSDPKASRRDDQPPWLRISRARAT